MSSLHDLSRAILAADLARKLDPVNADLIRAAFDGDVEAAEGLAMSSLSSADRGLVAVLMWRTKVPRPAFAAYLEQVWLFNHLNVKQAAGTRRSLAAMFRYAAFPIPDHLPPVVRVWRGTCGVTARMAERGYSWTTDRNVAAWFACRYAEDQRHALVLVDDVPKSEIAYFTNERHEQEALLFRQRVGARVDGVHADWLAGFEAHQKAIRQANETAIPQAGVSA